MKKLALALLILIGCSNKHANIQTVKDSRSIDSIATLMSDSTWAANYMRDDYVKRIASKINSYVVDFENLLSKDDIYLLTQSIISHEKKTSNEMLVLTIDDIGAFKTDFNAFALALSKKLGVGKKIKNNGVTIMVSNKLRKVRISTGLGLEQKLTNAQCQQIIDRDMIPELRKKNYATGITNGVNEIIKILEQ
jgi:uncharacterized membrane protein YgcG